MSADTVPLFWLSQNYLSKTSISSGHYSDLNFQWLPIHITLLPKLQCTNSRYRELHVREKKSKQMLISLDIRRKKIFILKQPLIYCREKYKIQKWGFNIWQYIILKKLQIWETVKHIIDIQCMCQKGITEDFIHLLYQWRLSKPSNPGTEQWTPQWPQFGSDVPSSHKLTSNILFFSDNIRLNHRKLPIFNNSGSKNWQIPMVQHNIKVFLSYLYLMTPTCFLPKIC